MWRPASHAASSSPQLCRWTVCLSQAGTLPSEPGKRGRIKISRETSKLYIYKNKFSERNVKEDTVKVFFTGLLSKESGVLKIVLTVYLWNWFLYLCVICYSYACWISAFYSIWKSLLILIPSNGPAAFSSFMSFADAINILCVASNQSPEQNWLFFYSSVIILPCSGRNWWWWCPLMCKKTKHRKPLVYPCFIRV